MQKMESTIQGLGFDWEAKGKNMEKKMKLCLYSIQGSRNQGTLLGPQEQGSLYWPGLYWGPPLFGKPSVAASYR